MKNYKVKAIRYFVDKEEMEERKVNDEFYCTKERYKFLKEHKAVELIEIEVEEEKEETIEKPFKKRNKRY